MSTGTWPLEHWPLTTAFNYPGDSSWLPRPSFIPVPMRGRVADNGGEIMEPIIICFECHKRTTLEDIQSGYHSHADVLEVESPFDPAVNAED